MTSAGFKLTNITISTGNAAVSGKSLIFSDLFQYTSGSFLGVQTTNWLTSVNGPIGHAGNGQVGTATNVVWATQGTNVTAVIGQGSPFNNGGAWAILNEFLSIRRLANYVVSQTFEYGGGSATANWGHFYQLLKFGTPGNSNSAQGIYVDFYCDNSVTPACTLAMWDDTGKVWKTAVALPIATYGTGPSTPITLATNVAGTQFTTFVNGMEAFSIPVTYNYAVNNANHVGFGAGF